MSACTSLTDKTIALVFSKGKKIVVYDIDKKSIQMLSFQYSPMDATRINDTFLAVNMFLAMRVIVVHVSEELVTEKEIHTAFSCYGIDYNNGVYYVSLPYCNKIQVLNDKKESYIHTGESAFYLKYNGDKLVCSNHILNKVVCVSVSGISSWEYNEKHDKFLTNPLCVSILTTGNILVSCRGTKAVIIISGDGQQSKLIVKAVDTIDRPRALGNIKKNNRFFICDECSGRIYLYKFK